MSAAMLTRRFLPNLTLLRTASLVVLGLSLAACKDDGPAEYTVFLQTDRTTLTADQSDSATVTVSILDQNFNPPPIGSTVILITQPGGSVNESGTTTGTAQTDALGYATFDVACTDENPLNVVGRFGDSTGILLPQPGTTGSIVCSPPPDGDWTVAISAEPRRISPGGAAQISVSALDSSRDPVPEGTSVTLSITSGSLEFSRGGTELTRSVDGSGRIETTVLAPSTVTEGTSTICATFSDARYGSAASCVGLVISSAQVTEAACTIAFSSTRIPADGTSVASVTFSVTDDNGAPVQNATVQTAIGTGVFVTAPGGSDIGLTQTLATDANGDAVGYLRAPTTAGSAALEGTANFTVEGTPREVSCRGVADLTYFGAPLCAFESINPTDLGVTNSGMPEQGLVRYCFTNSDGTAVGAGESVRFDWDVQLEGASFETTNSLTDLEGCATARIRTGTQAGQLVVRATLGSGAQASTCPSPSLSVRGGLPVGEDLVLRCETDYLGTLANQRGSEVPSDCEISCWTYLRDRYENAVQRDDVRVSFRTEQGRVIGPVTADANGRVEVKFQPDGLFPADVDPVDGESRVFGALTGEAVNPRDGVVTLIAYTVGEESWDDTDGDGVFDDGEVWTDLPEPFVDVNDNDEFDPENPAREAFVDVQTPDRDFNGEWDEANGEWDNSTVIWTRTAITLVGEPAVDMTPFVRDSSAPEYSPTAFTFYLSYDSFGSVNAVRPGESTFIAADAANFMAIVLVDEFFNTLPPDSTTISHEVSCEGATIEGTQEFPTDVPPPVVRVRSGYDFAGRLSSTPDLLRWTTEFLSISDLEINAGGAPFFAPAAPIPFVIEVEAGASGDCQLNTTVTVLEAESCERTVVYGLPPIGLQIF